MKIDKYLLKAVYYCETTEKIIKLKFVEWQYLNIEELQNNFLEKNKKKFIEYCKKEYKKEKTKQSKEVKEKTIIVEK